MTYEQILKEFGELDYYETPNVAHGEPVIVRKKAKSFLKQSFIKYLQGECERLSARRYELSCLDYGTYGNTVEELDSQITHINNQIKEIETI